MYPLKFTIFPLILVLVISGTGISGAYTHTSPGDKVPCDWLFLVYMDADNNLGSAADNNLAQLMAVGSNPQIKIIVLVDRNGFGDTALYLVEKNKLSLLEDGGTVIPPTKEVNMGSPSTLNAFLNFSTKFEHNHTFLVLWDHGSGWRGFCTDSQSKDSLNLPEIKEALAGFKIDVLGIDACQGALMEVVYALRNSADYFVGSQKDEPESGWNYTMLLKIASSYSKLTPEMFAESAVEAFERHYRNYSLLSVSVALSAINLTKIEALAEKLDRFSMTLRESTPLLYSEIAEARNATEAYEGNSRGDVDIGDFAKKSLKSSYTFTVNHGEDLLQALKSTVIKYCGITASLPASGVRADNTTGLSIYFPKSNFNGEYLRTNFALENNWSKFILEFLNPKNVKPKDVNVSWEFGNQSVHVFNPENKFIYICDSTGKILHTSNENMINYTVPVADYYQIFAYSYTQVDNDTYLNGIAKSGKEWVGERKPNIRIKNVVFYREDGVRILGDTGKHPVENRSFLAMLQIENTGNVNLSTNLSISAGNITETETLALEINSSKAIYFSLSLSSGIYTFYAVLDPVNNIRETNESDNVYGERISVLPKSPNTGIEIKIVSDTYGECRIYNASGGLIGERKFIGNTTIFIPSHAFREGDYLYIHIYTENGTQFRKIQVFSEDKSYEVRINLESGGFNTIDYILIGASTALFILIVIFVIGLIRLRKIN
ncbi:MAG: clostripain-related cysteine peptidase [Thermoplasmata archaeon]